MHRNLILNSSMEDAYTEKKKTAARGVLCLRLRSNATISGKNDAIFSRYDGKMKPREGDDASPEESFSSHQIMIRRTESFPCSGGPVASRKVEIKDDSFNYHQELCSPPIQDFNGTASWGKRPVPKVERDDRHDPGREC